MTTPRPAIFRARERGLTLTNPLRLPAHRVSGCRCLLVIVALALGSGCDQDSVRGAGSIDIPKGSLQRYSYSKKTPAPKHDARRHQNPGR